MLPSPRRQFVVGDRVRLVGSHSRAGERGEIVAHPNTLFNGWGVRLDSGITTGAGNDQMRKEEGNDGE